MRFGPSAMQIFFFTRVCLLIIIYIILLLLFYFNIYYYILMFLNYSLHILRDMWVNCCLSWTDRHDNRVLWVVAMQLLRCFSVGMHYAVARVLLSESLWSSGDLRVWRPHTSLRLSVNWVIKSQRFTGNNCKFYNVYCPEIRHS